MTTIKLEGKEYTLTREPTPQDWKEIYALNRSYKMSQDLASWTRNIMHLIEKGNPLAIVKLQIAGEQRRLETDNKNNPVIGGNVYA